MLLPTGAEAATARENITRRYIDQIREMLPDTASRDIRDLITNVRADPLDVPAWGRLESALFAAAHRDRSSTFAQWSRTVEHAKQGRRIALKMRDIADAGAPICDAHGPMSSTPDASAPRGTRWWCEDDPNCLSRYWWLDGSHLTRGA